MTQGIAGKVVVITGASSGLGEATARHLADAGAAVVLGARRSDRIQALAKKLRDAGAKALAVTTDVTRPEQVQALVDAAVQAFGRVDVIINNAGLMPHSPLGSRRREIGASVLLLAPGDDRQRPVGKRPLERQRLS